MPEIGVFTNDIRNDLLSGKADIAVHSWKDLPVDLEEGTKITWKPSTGRMQEI